MKAHQTPLWEDLMFSINPKRLSINLPTQPDMKYLKITVYEHKTGNKAIIPEYPCKRDHFPSIEELLLFLMDKSGLYVDALNSPLAPHCFMSDHFQMKNCQQGLKIFLHARECFKALCALLKGTGVSISELEQILETAV